jgi:A1 cistron-splicing factor AAR2
VLVLELGSKSRSARAHRAVAHPRKSAAFAPLPSRMQPVELEQRARQFSVLVALDVPAGSSVGVDCMVWLTGEKFAGVKMIPPGFHIVTSAVSDAHGGTSPRSGFFLWLGLQEVIVRKFLSADECFADERAVTYEEQQHWEHGVRSLRMDDQLAAYADDKWQLWRRLTNCIDYKFASLICDGRVRFFAGGHQGASSQLPLSQIPRFISSPSTDPLSVTAECLDPSPVLHRLIHGTGAIRVLAELQLSFILFIFCEDFDGLEHWKRLVHLVCRSETFLIAHQEFLFNFIGVFKRQLQNIPADFFQDVISCENFLRPSLGALLAAVDSGGASLQPALVKRCSPPSSLHAHKYPHQMLRCTKFKGFLEKRFGMPVECIVKSAARSACCCTRIVQIIAHDCLQSTRPHR